MAAPSSVKSESPWTAAGIYRRLLVVPLGFLALFFIWPIALVVGRSFTDPAIGLGNYIQILSSSANVYVLVITIQTATVVTLLCLIIAYPLAYAISLARGMLMNVMVSLVVISLWTSVVIRSYSWMVLLARKGVVNQVLVSVGLTEKPVAFLPSMFAVNVGMVHIMLPFMVLPLLANMRSIDRSLLSAAAVMGATPMQAFVRVFLPLSLPGVFAGSALVFMLSLGFFITPALLGGTGQLMMAVLIEQQASQLLNWGVASALSTILLVITLVIFYVYLSVTNKYGGGAINAH